MGLELNLKQAMNSLRSTRLVTLTLVWSWIIGPAVAYLITKILPLSEPHAKPHAIGLLIIGLAPAAPLLPLLIRKARGDMDVAAAVMPLAVVGTVVLMPLITPLLIPGASVSSFALAKQLFLTVLLPLAAGVAMNVYASQATVRVFPYVKKLAGLSTAALVVLTVIFYGREFLDVLGSFAIAAQVLWMLAIGLVSYVFGFGMKQAQRSALSLGVCSRNGGVTLVAFAAFPTQEIVLLFLARFFASRAAKAVEQGS
jgi:BASS family bile acid:Na+ symporter